MDSYSIRIGFVFDSYNIKEDGGNWVLEGEF